MTVCKESIAGSLQNYNIHSHSHRARLDDADSGGVRKEKKKTENPSSLIEDFAVDGNAVGQ